MEVSFEMSFAWLISLLLFSMTNTTSEADSPVGALAGSSTQPAMLVLDWLDGERTRFAGDLANAHARLLARATTAAPALLPRIEPEPPKPRLPGYQRLPELKANDPERRAPLTETRYSLLQLSTAFAGDLRDASLLERRVAMPEFDLEKSVAELERLRSRLSFLESSIAYHRFWQASVLEHPQFFAEKNEWVARARAMKSIEATSNDPIMIEKLRVEIVDHIAPFVKTPGISMQLEADGSRCLSLAVVTDIVDESFLSRFAEAVESTWNQSAAARDRRLRIALTWKPIAPKALYESGAPEVGAAIDEIAHLARFEKGSLVLTTGAKSTHAKKGHYIQLGRDPITQRSLAHEFGHLLGFDDAYLRGTEGKPTDPYGCVFVEWSGLADDLMGDSLAGCVTTRMIDQLIRAYGSVGS